MTVYVGGDSGEIFNGSDDNDKAYGNGGNDRLFGNGGDDTLDGGSGADLLNGGVGRDILVSHLVNSQFYLDLLAGDLSFDSGLRGGVSLDTGLERDELVGGDGNDHIAAGYGDLIAGGDGNDTLYLNLSGATQGVVLDMAQQRSSGSITVGGGDISGIDALAYLMGSRFDDNIVSIGSFDASRSRLYGNDGNDVIVSDAYSILVSGGAGDDIINAQASPSNFTAYGDDGDDLMRMAYSAVAQGGAGDDHIIGGYQAFGGDGDDWLEVDPFSRSEGWMMGEAGNDLIVGQDGVSYLFGGSGADRLYGNGGNDFMQSAGGPASDHLLTVDRGTEQDSLYGGAGDDDLRIGYGDIVDGGDGWDILDLSLAGATSGVVLDVAALLSGAAVAPGGGAIANIEEIYYITGSAFSDRLILTDQFSDITVDAGGGNDIVQGGDTRVIFDGGDGDDVFFSGWSPDIIRGGTGIDTVDYSRLAENVSVVLAGGFGHGGDVLTSIENVVGSAYADDLSGDANNNMLDGGAGDDTLAGGAGDDVYVVDSAQDVVIEVAGQGYDSVRASVSYSLAGTAVEELVLTGTANINAQGGAADNVLVGNGGNNILDGGAGVDRMTGGNGDDIYYVDNALDVVNEAAGGGVDEVRTSAAAYSLSANVENLRGVSATGQYLVGNALANEIRAGSGDDRLDGGAGADTLIGGLGDDAYYVDNAGDVIVEHDGEGSDRVFATASVDLSGNFVEDLLLQGSANINGIGNALNNIIQANSGNNVLVGGAGIDILTYRSATSAVTISLAATGPQATGGSGTDTVSGFEDLRGSLYSDHLTGDNGSNVIDGDWGADTMIGLGGNDIYIVDHALDNVVEVAGQGNDTIYSFVSYSLEGRDVEMLALQSGMGALNATGNAKANTLIGNDDANILDGKGGADLLIGDKGDDVYIVDGAGTRVIEAAGEGQDSVRTSVDLNLAGQSIETVVMLGTARSLTGGNVDSRITGNDVTNLIVAGAGDDRVFGRAGDDRIEGGAGRDYLDGGAGVDSVSYEHATAGVVVSLAISGAQNTRGAGVDALVGFENIRGSTFDDRLTGDDHGNVISGLDGADVMIGLFGDDVYYVDNVGDKVVEKIHDGYDSVFAAVDYTLSAHVEALTLTGRADIDATGNAQDNVLTGNSGDNRLNGGVGSDLMIGKGGDDIYHVSSAGDVVVEQAGEGHDLVLSSVSWTLGDNVEDLRLVGSGHLIGRGNALANDIRGNAGNNTLWGGAGNDLLTGGAGIDNFVFDTALGAGNVDRITDFSVADDSISLFRSAFGALGGLNGSLAAAAFQTGSVALEADDRILYDGASGNIFYDADGSGAGAAILFAQVTPGLALSHLDFVVLG
ncbi:beta strand repeat-containing protein [Sphingobium sp. CAP-1]|uniref:beta strand repeat-containing protein n=1 Tax=Sphingobium sp. CAP-1 TaxID=2676077 RepID=UPI0012BB2E7E|nr:calcium-binding protein [Sphingobium sp. CAP-1]QGP78033.1 hypothetical protein GL174_02715 [Sphingobium sp. CAP-1]